LAGNWQKAVGNSVGMEQGAKQSIIINNIGGMPAGWFSSIWLIFRI
jgi:hypothetical protein